MPGALPLGTADVLERRLTPEPQRALPTDPVRWVRDELDEYLWSHQRDLFAAVQAHRHTAWKACHGPGKALDPETPLPTPRGWTTMRDVRVGDELLDERGRPCRVVGMDEWHDRPCYRVTFDDGTTVVADAEHVWSVTTFRRRATRRARVSAGIVTDWRHEHSDLAQLATTRGLRSMLRTGWGQRDTAVPLSSALDLPKAPLPVDPYVLGIYLADGTRANGGITVARSEAWWIEPRLGGHRVPSSERPSSFVVRVPGLGAELRALGALDPKRIPPTYLRASIRQRLAVLHGVMDGDGFADDTSAGIDLTHEALAMDVLELMRSLGLRPTVRTGPAVLNGRRVGTRWRIHVTPTFPVFSLPTKLRQRPSGQACRYTQRMVTSIEPVGPRATKCVEVDSPSHLYLCGEGMIPTHNSYSASRLIAWWIAGHPPGDAIGLTTAPSGHQVRSILWREIARAKRKGGLEGSITRGAIPEWTIDGELVAFGRKPQDYVDADQARAAFQGIHARYVLVVLDEAGGIPEWLWEAVDTLVTNEASRILAIGNPDDPTTHFAKVCRPGSGWHVLRTSAFDTPNFTGERVPEQLREELTSKLWVAEREREWGVESPLYISKVLGEFPEVADDVIVTPKMVREAHERDLTGGTIGEHANYGMDVARFGADETCIYEDRAGVIRLVAAWRKTDTDTSRARAQGVLDARRVKRGHMAVDVVGLGAGVYDPLRNRGYPVVPFSGGAAAHDSQRFVNVSAEAWWAFREDLEAGLIDLDPEDLTLAAQLQARKWKLDASQRRIRIETKDEMKARGVPSPDRADSAIMARYGGAKTFDSLEEITRMDPGEPLPIAGDLLERRW